MTNILKVGNDFWTTGDIINILAADYPKVKRDHLIRLSVEQIARIASERFGCKFEVIN